MERKFNPINLCEPIFLILFRDAACLLVAALLLSRFRTSLRTPSLSKVTEVDRGVA